MLGIADTNESVATEVCVDGRTTPLLMIGNPGTVDFVVGVC